MRFEAGSEFAGYTVVSRLGRGGMATVYLVREPGIDRLVALKVLPEQLVDDAQFAARFEQEARLIGSLDHPNIIPLYRYGITDDMPWMALRYVEGGDFSARLAKRPLPVPEGLSLLREVAAALDYAHRKGVIHRDLKPQNILLTGGSSAYLADFGVAKILEGSLGMKTVTGGVIGTPAYMAPEQARGLQLGAYTDVYALAVICFQWLTGSLPFDADTPQAILMKHALEPVPSDALKLLSPNIAAVIARGLAKRPEDRIQSASALISQLEHALSTPAATSSPTASAPQRHEPPSSGRLSPPAMGGTLSASNSRWKAVTLFVLALALCAGGYAYWREVWHPVAQERAARQAAAEAVASQAAQAAADEERTQKKRLADETAARALADKQAAEKSAAQAAAAAQAQTIQSTLIVKSDSDCQLTINGASMGALQANKATSVKVNPGEQLIECTGSNASGARAQMTKRVAAGVQAVVVLALAEKVADKRPEESPRAATEPSARDERNSGFVDLGNGVLKDTRTGLEWTQADNGSDIGWNGARKYCADKTGGWRLPSVDELAAIYDANVPSPRVCAVFGALSYTCKTSALFQLTSTAFWSATAIGSAKSWDVLLFSGLRDQVPVDYSHDVRALCVRSR